MEKEQDRYEAVRAAQRRVDDAYASLHEAVNALVVAELESRRQQLREEFYAERRHEEYVRRSNEAAIAARREAAVLRGDPDPGEPRRCTTCRRPEGDGPGQVKFYQRKARPSSLCIGCEKTAKLKAKPRQLVIAG